MIKHLVWDWNGTLLDDVDACVGSLNAMLHPRGMSSMTAARYREEFGFPVRAFYESLGFDFSVDDWDAVAVEFIRLYEVEAVHSPLRPGTVPVLEYLRRSGLCMSILSASESSMLRRMIRERGIESYFERISGLSHYYASSKIDLGREMLDLCGHQPDEIVIVGDTQHDYEVATELGCHCVLLDGGHQTAERLSAHGCPVLPDIADVPRYVAAL